MLVLSRKKNETICIDGDIEVTVLEVRGDRVRLGVVAPREVRVLRKELLTGDEADSCATLPDSSGCETVLSIAEEPIRDDSLRSESARNQTTRNGRNGGWQPSLPR